MFRILLVDDHPVVRMGLAALINAETDLQVCGHAEDVSSALAALDALCPDLIIVDLSLRDSSGFDLLRETTRRGLRAIVVSMHEAPIWAQRALAAGARGYVQKSEAGRNIVAAIRKVRGGRLYVSEALSELLLERGVAGNPTSDPAEAQIDGLSDRELDVLQRIGQGATTQQIGAELGLSPKTIQTYRERIKRKLALGSAAELSSAATRWVIERSDALRSGKDTDGWT